MYGWSREGMMTYLTLTRTKKVKVAAVDRAPSDLTFIDRPEMETSVYSQLILTTGRIKKRNWKGAPLSIRQKNSPKEVPMLILHGNADWRLKPEQSLQFLELQKHPILIPSDHI